MKYFVSGRRTRVTELALSEGDVVSVIGIVQERVVGTGAFRQAASERVLVMPSGSTFQILTARIEEIRWPVAFHRRSALGHVAMAALGLTCIEMGIVLLIG